METKLYVKLISNTPNPEMLISSAAKLCYSPLGIKEVLDIKNPQETGKLIKSLTKMGHESPLEHISYSFGIEGFSRVAAQQLTRHRVASFSMKSQRYVKENQFDFITPPSITEAGLEKDYFKMMQQAQENYNKLSKEIEKRLGLKGELNNQDARYILPNATETKLIMTMNARELLHFFEVRTCNRAQWEIRNLAKEMFKLVLPTAPNIFKYTGPSCVSKGKCREGKLSCGLEEKVKEEFKNIISNTLI